MENDEKFLRQQVRDALKKNSTKYLNTLPEDKVVMVEDEAIRFWRQQATRGVDALKHAMQYARTTFKKKTR